MSTATLLAPLRGNVESLLLKFNIDDDACSVIASIAPELLVGLFTVALVFLLLRFRGAPYISKSWAKYKITERRVVSSGPRPVVFLTVAVSTKDMPTGSHVKIRAVGNDGEEVIKSYTPTRFDGSSCEILIRIYPSGKMTPLLNKLGVGDSIEMMGPTGLHRYGTHGPGNFTYGKRSYNVKKVGMLAGGTGVTPMVQIINKILEQSEDKTEVTLCLFSSEADDILLQEELRSLASFSPKLTVKFLVSSSGTPTSPDITHSVSMRNLSALDLLSLMNVKEGEVSEAIGLICGPDGFVKHASKEFKGGAFKTMVW